MSRRGRHVLQPRASHAAPNRRAAREARKYEDFSRGSQQAPRSEAAETQPDIPAIRMLPSWVPPLLGAPTTDALIDVLFPWTSC